MGKKPKLTTKGTKEHNNSSKQTPQARKPSCSSESFLVPAFGFLLFSMPPCPW